MSLVAEDMVKRLKIPIKPTRFKASGVTGHALEIVGQARLTVKVGETTVSHLFKVVKGVSYVCLLGNDLFEQLGEISFNMRKRTMRVNGVEVLVNGGPQTVVRLVAAVTIAPNTKQEVEGRVGDVKGLQLFEPSLQRHGLFCSRSLDNCRRGIIRVSMVNAGHRPMTIEAGTVLGDIEAYDEGDICIPPESVGPKHPSPGDQIDLDKTDLTEVEKRLVRLLVNEYKDVMAGDLMDLPGTDILDHHIDVQPGTRPIRSKPYTCPVGLQKEVKRQLDEMLEAGIIEPSEGEWCSPIVLVKKRDNSWRFCVDYRRLNDVTVKQGFPMTSVDDVVDRLHGKKYFSSIDLFSGFWQLNMDEASRAKTGFITHEGCFQFKRMPFGLTNSPFSLQKLAMCLNLDLISNGTSMAYVDDWVYLSDSFNEHFKLLQLVFTRLRKARLRLKLSKCSFFQKELVYLGHTITREGLGMEPRNVEKMTAFPSPTTPRQCRRLNGLFSYYRKFIPRFSERMSLITRLTKKDVKFEWTKECEAAKQDLIKMITTAPILAFPCFTRPFILTTDASAVALAGVLSQEGEKDKFDHPIAFYSRMLNTAESKYGATEQELMAIVMAIRHFAKFLYNTTFTIFTDNIACVSLMRKPNVSHRLARWALSVQEFSYEVKHKVGSQNYVCDALSRAKVDAIAGLDSSETEPEVVKSDLMTEMKDRHVREAQRKDFYLGPILLYMKTGKFPPDADRMAKRVIKQRVADFVIKEKVLYRLVDGRYLLAVPVTMRRDLLLAHHDSLMAMHPGVTKTMLRLKEQYWFPRMRRTVQKHVAECELCQHRKDPKAPIRLPIKNIISEKPMDVLAIDFQGPYTMSSRGMKHILVFTDHFSKWMECFATADQKADTVAKLYVDEIFTRYGASKIFMSDRALNFMSDVIVSINKVLQVEQRRTTPYHPQCNGLVEVTNRTIGTMISHFVSADHKDWDLYVPFCRLAHNSARHTIVNASPSMILMGREMRLPYELLLPDRTGAQCQPTEAGNHVPELVDRMQRVWEAVRRNRDKAHGKQRMRFAKKTKESTIKVGDAVFYRNQRGYRGLTSKLVKKWIGPFMVQEVTDVNARMVPFNDPDAKPIWVHMNKLKLYLSPSFRGQDENFEVDLMDDDLTDGGQITTDDDRDSTDDEPGETSCSEATDDEREQPATTGTENSYSRRAENGSVRRKPARRTGALSTSSDDRKSTSGIRSGNRSAGSRSSEPTRDAGMGDNGSDAKSAPATASEGPATRPKMNNREQATRRGTRVRKSTRQADFQYSEQ